MCRAPFTRSSADELCHSSPTPFLAGIKAARQRIVARTDEDRESFLRKKRILEIRDIESH
jgi:hypothetical protein